MSVTAETDDGALDEALSLHIWSECGNQASIDFQRPLSDLNGRFGDAGAIEPDANIELTTGFFRDRMWLGVYVVLGGRSILQSTLPPFGTKAHDVDRTEVERQPGDALVGGNACAPL